MSSLTSALPELINEPNSDNSPSLIYVHIPHFFIFARISATPEIKHEKHGIVCVNSFLAQPLSVHMQSPTSIGRVSHRPDAT